MSLLCIVSLPLAPSCKDPCGDIWGLPGEPRTTSPSQDPYLNHTATLVTTRPGAAPGDSGGLYQPIAFCLVFALKANGDIQ